MPEDNRAAEQARRAAELQAARERTEEAEHAAALLIEFQKQTIAYVAGLSGSLETPQRSVTPVRAQANNSEQQARRAVELRAARERTEEAEHEAALLIEFHKQAMACVAGASGSVETPQVSVTPIAAQAPTFQVPIRRLPRLSPRLTRAEQDKQTAIYGALQTGLKGLRYCQGAR